MECEWRCKNKACGALLGIEDSPRIHMRYKQAQWVIEGGDFNVIAVCPRCSTVNERRGHGNRTSPVAAPQ